MYLISSNTLSSTILRLYNTILSEGFYQESRNGGCTSLPDVTLEFTNPRSRHLSLEGRNSNLIAMIAETFWVMAGEDKVNPYLSYFLPRAPNYSDDGIVWHGAYGPRMYNYGQFRDALEAFEIEGLNTRRSFVTISDPKQDNKANISEVYGEDHSAKDIPCNRELHFYVFNNKFHTKAIQRSGDAIFGTGSINPFEFSFIHELMFNEIKKTHPNLELGPYRWHVTNAHLYDFSVEQAVTAIDTTANYAFSSELENDMPLIGPEQNMWKPFFGDLVEFYTEIIVNKEKYEFTNGNDLIFKLWDIFRDYNVQMHDNILFEYASLVLSYITSKEVISESRVLDISSYDPEFKYAIEKSKFVKFDYISEAVE